MANEIMIDEEVYQELKRMIKHDRNTITHKSLCTAFVEYVRSGHATFLLLKDDNVSKVWKGMHSTALKNIKARKDAIEKYTAKMEVYNRLTPEEQKVLGIKKPVKPKGYTE